jgi:hypothetical protein
MSLIFSPDTIAICCFQRDSSILKRALLLVLTIGLGTAAFAAAPYSPTDQPFVDDEGRTRVVVDFLPGAEKAYPDAVQPRPRTRETDDGRKIDFFTARKR